MDKNLLLSQEKWQGARLKGEPLILDRMLMQNAYVTAVAWSFVPKDSSGVHVDRRSLVAQLLFSSYFSI